MTKSIFAVAVAAVLAVTSFTASAGVDKWTEGYVQGTSEYMYTNKQNQTVNFSCSADRPMSIHLDSGNKSKSNMDDGRAVFVFNGDARKSTELEYNDGSNAGESNFQATMEYIETEKSVTIVIDGVKATFPLTGTKVVFKDNECFASDTYR